MCIATILPHCGTNLHFWCFRRSPKFTTKKNEKTHKNLHYHNPKRNKMYENQENTQNLQKFTTLHRFLVCVTKGARAGHTHCSPRRWCHRGFLGFKRGLRGTAVEPPMVLTPESRFPPHIPGYGLKKPTKRGETPGENACCSCRCTRNRRFIHVNSRH